MAAGGITGRALAGIGLAVCLWLIGAAVAAANTEPSFRLADGYPRQVGRSVTGLAAFKLSSNTRDDLVVLDGEGRQIKYFRSQNRADLRLLFRRAIPASVGGWSARDSSWTKWPAYAITNPDEGTVTVINGPISREGGSEVMRVADIGRPATAVDANFSHHNSRVETPLVTVNTATDDLSIEYMDPFLEFWTGEPLPVGDQPVDLDWTWNNVMTGGNHSRMVTVNRGSDDLTLIDFEWFYMSHTPPVATVVETVPVGDSPVDVVTRQNRLFVANQGSNSVTQLRLGQDLRLHQVAEYPVGEAPTSIAIAKLNNDRYFDLVVTNGGSDDISFLLGGEDGRFRPAGRIPVGDHPVAATELNYGGFFVHDLAVANEGDGTVSILEWNETSGTCQGRPARRYVVGDDRWLVAGGNPNQVLGTPGDDTIYPGGGGDCVRGRGGNDEIVGLQGRDRFVGGPGNDRISGGAGSDLLLGGRGDDFLCENYVLDHRSSRCWLEGRDLDLEGDARPNVMRGGPGNDTLESGRSRDRMYGGPGNDLIISEHIYRKGDRPDWIDCGPGHDVARVGKHDRVRNCEVVKRS